MDGGTLTVGGDILSTSSIAIEAVAAQGGATTGDWGVDSISPTDSSSSGGIATPNAAVFDFTSSPTAIDHFGVTVLDFEGGFDNGDGVQQSAFIRIYDAANNLVDNQAINFSSPDFGDGEEIHIGVFADGMTISKVVLVLGDDNDTNTANGWGGGEAWAATRFTLGFAAPDLVAPVPEPSSLALLMTFGLCGLARRRRVDG